jgi:hypothetical protein
MAAITQTNTIERVQVLNPSDEDPSVQRWMSQQIMADGVPVGAPQFLQLKARPSSSFETVADLYIINTDDILEGQP